MVVVTWDPVLDASAYDVTLEVQVGGGWVAYASWIPPAPPLTMWPQTSPATYRVRVRARGADGDGPWSAWLAFDFEADHSVITLPGIGEPSEAAPQDLWPSGTVLSGSSVTVSYTHLTLPTICSV